MAYDGDINMLKHQHNKKTLSCGKMAHVQVEMGIVNKMASIDQSIYTHICSKFLLSKDLKRSFITF